MQQLRKTSDVIDIVLGFLSSCPYIDPSETLENYVNTLGMKAEAGVKVSHYMTGGTLINDLTYQLIFSIHV